MKTIQVENYFYKLHTGKSRSYPFIIECSILAGSNLCMWGKLGYSSRTFSSITSRYYKQELKWWNILILWHTSSNFCRYHGFVANGDVGIAGRVAARIIGGREVVVDVVVSFILIMLSNWITRK